MYILWFIDFGKDEVFFGNILIGLQIFNIEQKYSNF